jgi:hypothetical protein
MIDQNLSLYIPLVFGPDDAAIARELEEQMGEQGLGIVSRVDVTGRAGGRKQAFVHFEEWFATAENQELHGQILASNTIGPDGQKIPPPRLLKPGMGYWLLLKNTSVSEPEEGQMVEELLDTTFQQSKTIRDLRLEVEGLKSQRQVKAPDSPTQQAWGRARERARQRMDPPELDQTVQRRWIEQSRSEPGVERMVILRPDGSWECDCPSRTECWHIRKHKSCGPAPTEAGLELEEGEIEEEVVVEDPDETRRQKDAVWDHPALASMTSTLALAKKVQEEMAELRGLVGRVERERDEAFVALEAMQDELAAAKAAAALPPPPPLRRCVNNPVCPDAESYNMLSQEREREGLEGESGVVAELQTWRDPSFVGSTIDGLGLAHASDITHERMVAQTAAFDQAARANAGDVGPEWREEPIEMLVDERATQISIAPVGASS